MDNGKIIFKPYFVQRGSLPYLLNWAYASDENWDAFYSDITASDEGVVLTDNNDREKFGINVRWKVEDFGYIFITADNGGEHYALPGPGKVTVLNLNYELAKSRVYRNRRRRDMHMQNGWEPDFELRGLIDLSENLLQDAEASGNDEFKKGGLAQKSLLYAMKASEMIELQKADYDIARNGKRDFFIGCDARGYYQMDPDDFLELFPPLFNYATITHYLISGKYQDFEPKEGEKQFNLRDAVFGELKRRNITVEGRPLFWFYRTTTPDWLRNKSYSELLKYVESHTREVVGHYGDGMYAWEVMNEAHDWANELQLKPEQIVEVAKLACDVAKDTNPNVHRLINNCCPFAEYVQLKKWGELDAIYPQRTPHQFMQDLVDADVDFTITGQQMYFPYRDLADTIILIDRMKDFGRPVQLTEVGTSSGANEHSVENGRYPIPDEPYIWHRHWDEELQAEWMEGLYKMAYSREWIEAVNWYDFVDPYSWIKTGGFLQTPEGEKKLIYDRLLKLKKEWGI